MATKQIADPVHGTIHVDEVASRLISTRAFQRLRNIKQLGLAHLVFPGADYSRFSHSVGVYHVTGKLLDALGQRVEISANERQKYQLAGLLHDVGHYPFSHAMEHALKDYFAGTSLLDDGEQIVALPEHPDARKSLNHEETGQVVIEDDAEIADILRGAGFEPADVYSIFRRSTVLRFSNLISSDLDADRIDYLLRTAHHTGLPYGSVDLPYLLSQIRLDDENRLCLHPRALRTAEHFLLSRYFDYQQVAFHKTVAGLELILGDVLKALLYGGYIRSSAWDVRRMITSGGWEGFDDGQVLEKIRMLYNETNEPGIKARAGAILLRRPPKLVGRIEWLGDRQDRTVRQFTGNRQQIQEYIPRWAEEFRVPIDRWLTWHRSGVALTKIGSRIPVSALAEGDEDSIEKQEQSIRILNPPAGTSVSIQEIPSSLLSVLADQALYSSRVYVLLSPEEEALRTRIEEKIRHDLPYHAWT